MDIRLESLPRVVGGLDRQEGMNRRLTGRWTLAVFLIALLCRSVLFGYACRTPESMLQPDSGMYVELAHGLKQGGAFSYPQTPEKPSVARTPGYPFFLSTVWTIFGGELLPVVITQILLDCLSCLFIYGLSETIWKGSGWLSGLLASVNIGMITYAHFILNDSLFVLLFVLSLLALFRFVRGGEWMWASLLGIAMGLGTIVRPAIVYLPFFIAPLFFVFFFHRGLAGAGGRVGVTVVLFLLCLSPWMVRNYLYYERFKLSAQSGEHLLQYIVPFVWQYSRGTPFIEGMKETSDEFLQKASEAGLKPNEANPFDVSDFQIGMAMDYLRSEPKSAILKAWIFGAVKNLFSPSIIDLSYLLRIERPHFFYIEGTTTLERAWNFIKGMKGWFGWAVIANIVVLVLSRIVQVWGLIQMMRRKPGEAVFFVLIIGYFLLVSGPVGYAKYRLPFEPILIVLLAIGLKDLYGRWKMKRWRLEERFAPLHSRLEAKESK